MGLLFDLENKYKTLIFLRRFYKEYFKTFLENCTYILRVPAGKEFDLELLASLSPVIEYFGNYRKKYGINAEGTHTFKSNLVKTESF